MKSVLGKVWSIKSVSERDVQHIMQRNQDIDYFLAKLLASRNISADNAQSFLNPKIRDFLKNPFSLLDMELAVNRVIDAIRSNERICVFGDYDVDGATSSALLKKFFSDIDINIDVYIPDRITEGYGPSPYAMHRIKELGVSLVITVDCGSTSFDAISAAREIGLDIIVVDHHMFSENMPDIVAMINPNRLDETTEYTYLAAVGVSFIFLAGLVSRLRNIGYFSHIQEPNLIQYLDLVALGTVCDVMPLIGLNRAFVTQGLKVISQRANLGLRILSDISSIKSTLSTYHLGFVLGPRINAGGRVGRANLGSILLSTNDEHDAYSIALELDRYNAERKNIEHAVLLEAIRIADSMADRNIIMVSGKGWHLGVIGVVAGRLKERYNKPIAVVTIDDNGICKASCRSVKGVDLGSKIIEAKITGILDAGGGHAMAAGFTVKESRLSELLDFLDRNIAAEYDIFKKNNICEYDIDITTGGLDVDFVRKLSKLAPFGVGNSEPVVKIDGLYVVSSNIVGEKHVSAILASATGAYKARSVKVIAFNAADNQIGGVLLSNARGSVFSVVGNAQINEWQGSENIQLIIHDIIIR